MTLVIGHQTFSQKPADKTSRSEKLMSQSRYAEAERLVKREVRKDKENGEIHERYAKILAKLQRLEESASFYERADFLSGLSNDGLLEYATVCFQLEEIGKSEELVKRYVQRVPNSFTAKLMLRSIERINEWKNASANYAVHHVYGLNSKYAEFAPIPFADGIVFSTARRVDHVNESTSGYADEPFLAVYYADLKQKATKDSGDVLTQMNFEKPKLFLRNLIGEYHLGPVALDTTNRNIIYTVAKDQIGKNKQNHLALYTASIVNDKRIKQSKVLFSSDSASFGHPTISPDGKTMVFASDVANDGYGMDLYIVKRTAGQDWGKPERLPASINSPMDEVFPYLKNDSTLYFSSKGHPGYGGLDIFISKRKGELWTTPINAKAPLNSSKDDFGISYSSENAGYFSSSRDGGQGLDDIYAFVQFAAADDSNRTEISGVFEYSSLPPDGVELALYDEYDNLLATVFTDPFGGFNFKGLPIGENYRIKLLDPSEDMLFNAKIFIVNEDGEKVIEMVRGDDVTFQFKTLPKEEIASLEALDESDLAIGLTYDLFGQLFTALDKDRINIKMVAETDDGRLIATTVTDSNGNYKFYGLPKTEFLFIRPLTGELTLYRSSVFYADDENNMQLTERGNNYFEYKIAVVNDDGSDVLPPARYSGFLQWNEKPMAGIPIIIMDQRNRIVEVMRSNERGAFDLRYADPNAQYKIVLPDSFQTHKISPFIYLVDRSTARVIKTTEVSFSLHQFMTPESIEASLNETQLAYFNSPYEINGQIFKKLPGDFDEGFMIYVYDKNGNVVDSARLDQYGKFKFTQLRPDETYIFKPETGDESSLNMVFFDETGKATESLRFAELQSYMYTALQKEQVKRLELLDTDDNPLTLNDDFIAGQIFYKLPGDYKAGIKLYALDDQGNVLDSAITDVKGNFKFKRLANQEEFVIEVVDADDLELLNVALFNFKGTFLGLLTLDDNKQFRYSKLILEAASELGKLGENDSRTALMYGQVYNILPGDYSKPYRIYAFDDEGVLRDVVFLSKDGKFKFTKLTRDESYNFKILDDNGEFNVILTDELGNVLDRLHIFNGEWTYDRLAFEQYQLKLMPEEDITSKETFLSALPEDEMVVEKNEEIEITQGFIGKILRFAFRSSTLKKADYDELDAIVTAWKNSEKQTIQIYSHIDKAEQKGNYSYSAERSVAIANYLFEKGVPLESMFIKNWEFDQQEVDCITKDCSETERALNRRSEVQLINPVGLASTPDYVINFGFNEWQLTEENEKVVRQVIEALRSKPGAKVKIDGFTDTWGSFESNQRISELRAKNIRNLLVLRGFDDEDMEVTYHGETIPRGGCILNYPCPVELRNENRRVEIRIE